VKGDLHKVSYGSLPYPKMPHRYTTCGLDRWIERNSVNGDSRAPIRKIKLKITGRWLRVTCKSCLSRRKVRAIDIIHKHDGGSYAKCGEHLFDFIVGEKDWNKVTCKQCLKSKEVQNDQ